MQAHRSILLCAAAALAGGAAGLFAYPYLQKMGLVSGGSGVTAPVMGDAGNLGSQPAVSALGRLEPESQIVQVSAPQGSRIERLGKKVKEGQFVAEDEPLAYLDTYPELLAARDLANTQLHEARERLKAETAIGQAAIAAAKLKIRQAEEVLPRQIEAQEAELRR